MLAHCLSLSLCQLSPSPADFVSFRLVSFLFVLLFLPPLDPSIPFSLLRACDSPITDTRGTSCVQGHKSHVAAAFAERLAAGSAQRVFAVWRAWAHQRREAKRALFKTVMAAAAGSKVAAALRQWHRFVSHAREEGDACSRARALQRP